VTLALPVAVVAPGAAFLTVVLLMNAVFSPRRNELVDKLRPYAYRSEESSDLSRPFLKRVLLPVIEQCGRFAGSAAPEQLQKSLRESLQQAGNPITLNAYLAVSGGLLGALVLGFGVLLVVSGRAVTTGSLLPLAFLVLLGLYAPKRWLSGKVKSRQQAIQRKLPDALDIIVVSMEAGLALDSAMAKVLEKMQGPLSEEIQRTLREIHLGNSRREALRELGARTGVKDLIAVMASVIQADQMGVSMAQTMRTQADEARLRRRQRAEERAHQAAVKMLFPLVLFILPSVMIVTIGPAALTIYHQFTSGLF